MRKLFLLPLLFMCGCGATGTAPVVTETTSVVDGVTTVTTTHSSSWEIMSQWVKKEKDTQVVTWEVNVSYSDPTNRIPAVAEVEVLVYDDAGKVVGADSVLAHFLDTSPKTVSGKMDIPPNAQAVRGVWNVHWK